MPQAQGDHDGKDIVRLPKHKNHVCWYRSDRALLVRRAEVWANRGRPAIGRNGLDNDYSKKEDLIEHEGKLCEKYCDDWNQELSFWGRRLGHNYQKEDKALEYYLTSMTEHCDNKC